MRSEDTLQKAVALGIIFVGLVEIFIVLFLSDRIGLGAAQRGVGANQIAAAAVGMLVVISGFLLFLQIVRLPTIHESNMLYEQSTVAIRWKLFPLLLIIPFGLLLGLSIFFFSSPGTDDAYITYWPAYSFSEFGEILNYNGARIEQSSSLLHVVILAFLHLLTRASFGWLGPLVSLVFAGLTLCATYRLASYFNQAVKLPAVLLTATSVGLVYWSLGGLETMLVAFCSVNLVLAYGNGGRHWFSVLWMIVATLLFAAVRPEAPIILLCLLVVFALFYAYRRRYVATYTSDSARMLNQKLLLLFLINIGVLVILFAFRRLYFGEWFPQPVLVKSAGFDISNSIQGGRYLFNNLFLYFTPTGVFNGIFLVLGLAFTAWTVFRARVDNLYVVLSLIFVAVYAAFIVFSGGDWMAAGRFVVPIIPFVSLFTAFLLWYVATRVFKSEHYLLWLGVGALVVIQVINIYWVAANVSIGLPIWKGVSYYQSFGDEFHSERYSWFERTAQEHIRDIPTIYILEEVVAQISTQQDMPLRVLSQQMGIVVNYIMQDYYGEVHVLDYKGLVDRTFITCPLSADFPRSKVGLDIPFDFYFQNTETLAEECGIKPPDIVFGLTLGSFVDSKEYAIIYHQEGSVVTYKNWSGRSISADQFIAVRNDLLPAIEMSYPETIDFNQIQP